MVTNKSNHSCKTFINFINLRGLEEVKETLAVFGFSHGDVVHFLCPLLWPLLDNNLMSQTLTWTPFYLRSTHHKTNFKDQLKKSKTKLKTRMIKYFLPNHFIKNRAIIIVIGHMVSFRQNRVLEVRIRIKEKLQLEVSWTVFYSATSDVFEILQSSLISFGYLHKTKTIYSLFFQSVSC